MKNTIFLIFDILNIKLGKDFQINNFFIMNLRIFETLKNNIYNDLWQIHCEKVVYLKIFAQFDVENVKNQRNGIFHKQIYAKFFNDIFNTIQCFHLCR
jgi:hypothetical protein